MVVKDTTKIVIECERYHEKGLFFHRFLKLAMLSLASLINIKQDGDTLNVSKLTVLCCGVCGYIFTLAFHQFLILNVSKLHHKLQLPA